MESDKYYVYNLDSYGLNRPNYEFVAGAYDSEKEAREFIDSAGATFGKLIVVLISTRILD